LGLEARYSVNGVLMPNQEFKAASALECDVIDARRAFEELGRKEAGTS
jgi:hypothetical protein